MAYNMAELTVIGMLLAALSSLVSISAYEFYFPKLGGISGRSYDEVYRFDGVPHHPALTRKRLDMPATADSSISSFVCTHRVNDCKNGESYAVFQCGDQECACVCPQQVTDLSVRLHNFKKFLARGGGIQG